MSDHHGGIPGSFEPPASSKTNTTSIVALVLAFCLAPIGLILGFVSLSQIRKRGESGKALAISAIVIGAVITLVTAIALAFVGIAAVAVKERTDKLADAKVGDCLPLKAGTVDLKDVPAPVDCTKPHKAEVYAVYPIAGETYPGPTKLQEDGLAECEKRYKALPEATRGKFGMVNMLAYFPGSELGWAAGFRNTICIAVDSTEHTKSVLNG